MNHSAMTYKRHKTENRQAAQVLQNHQHVVAIKTMQPKATNLQGLSKLT
jgi:hypothetical protein